MKQYDSLKNYLKKRTAGGIALAYSGGMESSLLLAVLQELREAKPFPLLALTMHSIFQSPEELRERKNAVEKNGVELKLFACDPLSIPEIKYNPQDRCYWCKRYLFSEFCDFAKSRNIATVIDGTNADDLRNCRPGWTARKEMKILSPLAELGITRTEVREMCKFRNLASAEKLSIPCMATRFEDGALLTDERIANAIDGEDLVRKLLPPTANVRLRIHASIARIEVDESFIGTVAAHHKEIAEGLKKLGFQFVTLDLSGFHSGCVEP